VPYDAHIKTIVFAYSSSVLLRILPSSDIIMNPKRGASNTPLPPAKKSKQKIDDYNDEEDDILFDDDDDDDDDDEDDDPTMNDDNPEEVDKMRENLLEKTPSSFKKTGKRVKLDAVKVNHVDLHEVKKLIAHYRGKNDNETALLDPVFEKNLQTVRARMENKKKGVSRIKFLNEVVREVLSSSGTEMPLPLPAELLEPEKEIKNLHGFAIKSVGKKTEAGKQRPLAPPKEDQISSAYDCGDKVCIYAVTKTFAYTDKKTGEEKTFKKKCLQLERNWENFQKGTKGSFKFGFNLEAAKDVIQAIEAVLEEADQKENN